MDKLCASLIIVLYFHAFRNISFSQEQPESRHFDVVVSGAGPVGMVFTLTLLHLYPEAKVLLLDKRTEYTRYQILNIYQSVLVDFKQSTGIDIIEGSLPQHLNNSQDLEVNNLSYPQGLNPIPVEKIQIKNLETFLMDGIKKISGSYPKLSVSRPNKIKGLKWDLSTSTVGIELNNCVGGSRSFNTQYLIIAEGAGAPTLEMIGHEPTVLSEPSMRLTYFFSTMPTDGFSLQNRMKELQISLEGVGLYGLVSIPKNVDSSEVFPYFKWAIEKENFSSFPDFIGKYQAIKGAQEAIPSDIFFYSQIFHRLERVPFPERVFPIGDSLSTSDPFLGNGLSKGLVEAKMTAQVIYLMVKSPKEIKSILASYFDWRKETVNLHMSRERQALAIESEKKGFDEEWQLVKREE